MSAFQRILGAAIALAAVLGMTACANSGYASSVYKPYAYSTGRVAASSAAPSIDGYEKMAENDFLGLYMAGDTAAVAVYDKKSNKLFETNPGGGSDDSSNGSLRSQFTLTYSDVNGKLTTMASYTESVARDQVTVKKQKNGMRVEYVVGDNARGVNDLPKKISDSRFHALVYDKVGVEDQKVLEKRYSHNEDTNVWTLRNVSNKQYIADLLKIFDKAGYTANDLARDNLENNIPASSVARKIFKVSVCYELEADTLKVTVPLDEVVYPKDYPLVQLDLLEYFGAGKDQDGYMLLPDGSGAIMNFRRVSAASKGYSAPVYGTDYTQPVNEKSNITQNVSMPVFGIKTKEQAVFGIIESGDALATVNANNAGAKNDYNQIYPSFTVIKAQAVIMGASLRSSYNKFQARPYQGDVAVRYFFLSGQEADYSHMAQTYQTYLVDKHKLTKLKADASLPLFIQTVGSIAVTKTFLGIRYTGQKALTGYEDDVSILKQLNDAGIANIKLRLLGWLEGGLNQNLATAAKAEGSLGTQEDRQELLNYCGDHGIGLYADVQFLTFQKDANPFTKYQYGAKTLDGKEAHANFYNPATMGINTQLDVPYRIILSSADLNQVVSRFVAGYRKTGFSQLSLGDIGNCVYSDYNANHTIDRQAACLIQGEQLEKLKSSVEGLMLDDANMPFAVLADSIVNVPSGNSGFQYESYPIPFYQMVLHGYKQMGSEAINFTADYQQKFLRAVEGGTSISFKWFYENADTVKTSDYTDLYAGNYSSWLKQAVESYRQLNAVLAPLQDQCIVGHEVLQSGVTKTAYENGTAIYVNYREEPVTINGHTIQGKSFYAEKGGSES